MYVQIKAVHEVLIQNIHIYNPNADHLLAYLNDIAKESGLSGIAHLNVVNLISNNLHMLYSLLGLYG